jgi:crossover junction endodeoxyribonuclease RuvC
MKGGLVMYQHVMGIDPGQAGGLALLNQSGAVLWVTKMPETEGDLIDLLRGEQYIVPQDGLIAILERAQSFPGQGVASSFKYGMHFGSLRATLIACRIPFHEVRPAIWQRHLGALSHGDKGVTKRIAQQLFPGEKVTHAIADALLIAEYGRRVYVG